MMKSHDLAKKLLALPNREVVIPRGDIYGHVVTFRQMRLHDLGPNGLDVCQSLTDQPVSNCFSCSVDTPAVLALALGWYSQPSKRRPK